MTGYTSLLVKTGQTTKYVDGDDGDLEIGVAPSFTVLDAGQYSGTTEITLEGVSENHTNNCVQDNKTGLMWQKEIAGYIGAGDGKGGYTNYFPWTTNGGGVGIWTYLAAANAANLSGYSDWRIPNTREILSLCDYETSYFFAGWGAYPGSIWSSNSYDLDFAYFQHIAQLSTLAKTDVSFVLLVRGSPTAPAAGGGSLISGMVG